MSSSWEPFGPSRREGPAPAPRQPTGLPREPARHLAVLACMDCRVDPLAALGLAVGDAVVLRNAGAQWSDDVGRSLELSRGLGVRRVQVLAHTDCAAFGGDDEAALTGARRTAERIRATVPELGVDAAQLDLGSGVIRPAG